MSDDKEEAVFRFEEAIKFYSEWGALKKAELLREQYSNLWPQPTEIVSSALDQFSTFDSRLM
jgi:hypothetical protein